LKLNWDQAWNEFRQKPSRVEGLGAEGVRAEGGWRTYTLEELRGLCAQGSAPQPLGSSAIAPTRRTKKRSAKKAVNRLKTIVLEDRARTEEEGSVLGGQGVKVPGLIANRGPLAKFYRAGVRRLFLQGLLVIVGAFFLVSVTPVTAFFF